MFTHNLPPLMDFETHGARFLISTHHLLIFFKPTQTHARE